MNELTIRLRKSTTTGKYDVIFEIDSDEETLSLEDERIHCEVIEKIMGQDTIGKVSYASAR
jgi:hypothetical protein